MPLETQIVRNGEPLKLHWGGFHVAAMVVAVSLDSGKGPWDDNTVAGIFNGGPFENGEPMPISPKDAFWLMSYPVIGTTPMNDGPYTLKSDYKFLDITDGEVLELKAGDVLRAYRAH